MKNKKNKSRFFIGLLKISILFLSFFLSASFFGPESGINNSEASSLTEASDNENSTQDGTFQDSISQDSTSQVSSKKDKNKKEKKIVRVACGINQLLYLDENGNVAGCCAEYIEKLAEINNWKLEFVPGTWNEQVDNLENGSIDILMPTQWSEERDDIFDFPEMILIISIMTLKGLIIKKLLLLKTPQIAVH